MTILIAWTRSTRSYEELYFASDSRTRDGRVFDNTPKLIALPRSDCALGYAGYTGNAYPMMLHISNAMAAYGPVRNRAMDLTEVKSHLVKVMNQVAKAITDGDPEDMIPADFELLFGGYSWLKKAFCIWTLRFDAGRGGFAAHPAKHALLAKPGTRGLSWKYRETKESIGMVAFAGDKAKDARLRLVQSIGNGDRLRKRMDGRRRLDMEPFTIIRDMLLDSDADDTIGGPPQLLKVHQHQNCTAHSVFWPPRIRSPHKLKSYLLGRPLLDYEHGEPWTLDAFSLRLSHANYSPAAVGEPARNFTRGVFLRLLHKRQVQSLQVAAV